MSEKIVNYKGRQYRQMWSGETKYGKRAKLQFLDGSKEFWVDASQVSGGGSSSSSRSGRGRPHWTCEYCGGNESNQVACDECA